MRRPSLATQTFLTCAAALIGISSTLPAFRVEAAPLTPKISWSPCYRELAAPFECGTVQVPLDHDDPNGAAISIAVVRLAALDPVSRIGSLFFNPGGPGGSGVDFVLRVGPLLGGCGTSTV